MSQGYTRTENTHGCGHNRKRKWPSTHTHSWTEPAQGVNRAHAKRQQYDTRRESVCTFTHSHTAPHLPSWIMSRSTESMTRSSKPCAATTVAMETGLPGERGATQMHHVIKPTHGVGNGTKHRSQTTDGTTRATKQVDTGRCTHTYIPTHTHIPKYTHACTYHGN